MSVVMVCGYPASGKSTVTKKITNPQTVILNRDTEGGTIAQLLPKLEAHLKAGTDVILDNLFPTIESRKPFIDLCKKYSVDIHCKLMTATIEDAQFNVVQRAIGLIGEFPTPEAIKKAKHTNVFPPTVLFKYKKEFQKPTVEEGFSDVELVKFVRQDDPTFTNKAIIVDYDGTLRECVGGNDKYPTEESHVEIKLGRAEVLQAYKDKGYLIFGLSNQSGVHKGDLTHEKCDALFKHTNKLLGFDVEYHFCPHQSAPLSCYCRKPMPGKFVELMLKYKLDRKQCIMVGDMTTDETFAKRSGIKYVDHAEFFK